MSYIINPGCLLGPAIWLSSLPESRIHQRISIRCHSSLNVPLSQFVFLSKVILWYSLLVWVSFVITAWIDIKSSRSLEYRNELGSIFYKLKSWAYIGLWLGAKPQSYFRLRLYNAPMSQWINYAFPQEQHNWHCALGHDDERNAKAELANKLTTEQLLHKSKIPCINTLHSVTRETIVNEALIFNQRNYFIKPNSLNGMRGCIRLLYKADSTSYHLSGFDLLLNPVSLHDKESILSYLRRLSTKVDILIQPLLTSHKTLKPFCANRDVNTIRVITCYLNQKIYIVNAMLELAVENSNFWARYCIRLSTGEIELTPESNNQEGLTPGLIVPFWPQICKHVKNAHQSLSPIKTVSWDVCVTPNGPIIIEGNSGWGISAPQVTCKTPLLNGLLKKAYLSNL